MQRCALPPSHPCTQQMVAIHLLKDCYAWIPAQHLMCLQVLNIWADRDLLFKPGLEDAKAAALKRQEALLAAKAEEAARQAAAAQALKRAAEAKLNPRSKAPRLAGEDQYGSAGAGRCVRLACWPAGGAPAGQASRDGGVCIRCRPGLLPYLFALYFGCQIILPDHCLTGG